MNEIFYTADVVMLLDYYPYGMLLPGRSESEPNTNGDEYRYSFQGMEKDDDIKGKGNSYDFGARMYDPRIGRWLKTDDYESSMPNMTPYRFAFNCPIVVIDSDGNFEEKYVVYKNSKGQITGVTRVTIMGKFMRGVDAYIYVPYHYEPPVSAGLWISPIDAQHRAQYFDYTTIEVVQMDANGSVKSRSSSSYVSGDIVRETRTIFKFINPAELIETDQGKEVDFGICVCKDVSYDGTPKDWSKNIWFDLSGDNLNSLRSYFPEQKEKRLLT